MNITFHQFPSTHIVQVLVSVFLILKPIDVSDPQIIKQKLFSRTRYRRYSIRMFRRTILFRIDILSFFVKFKSQFDCQDLVRNIFFALSFFIFGQDQS